ncbi:MAG TPA: PEGA domain-containing protein [Terriglobales bacterium]|nr:PEGA domain-containing protein [Terriglobales bacterium]
MKRTCSLTLALFFALLCSAKDQPAQVIIWPESGTQVIKFSFGKFKEVASLANRHEYAIDTIAENTWSKKIPSITFTLYVYDKSKVRIGEGYVNVNDLAPGQVAKFQTNIGVSGTPYSLELVPSSLPADLRPLAPPAKISVTVNSVPQGALVNVDGVEQGTTPKLIQVGVGKHTLEFSKEGFNTGHFPLEVGPNDASGGSVSYELGTSAHDTIELRDGSVLSGDLESVSATEAVVRIGGTAQHYSRNQIKRISLVERDAPQP